MGTKDITKTWSIGARMRVVRLNAHIEQGEIANLLGVSRNTVSAWELGKSEPPFSQVVRWAIITDQPLDWLAAGIVEKDSFYLKRARRDSNPQPSDP